LGNFLLSEAILPDFESERQINATIRLGSGSLP
jgi:hypothetical protein